MTHPRIPKLIHYCWFGGAPMSALGRQCVATWRHVMPDYQLRLWDETRLRERSAYVDSAYRLQKFAFVADYVRIRALYDEGGLYFDTDIEALRPFDDLLERPMFLGLQTSTSAAVGVIGAVSGHPFLKRVLDSLDAEATRGRPSFRPLPDLITELLRTERAHRPELFPAEYFYPYNPYSPDPLRRKLLQSNISPRTYCIHHWEGAWLQGVSLGEMLKARMAEAWRKVLPRGEPHAAPPSTFTGI